MALDLLRSGSADAVVAGGAEACVLPLTIDEFRDIAGLELRVPITILARPPALCEGPGWLCDVGRGGHTDPGKGRAAKSRGARRMPPLAGFGQACDAAHIVMPDMNGQVAAMRGAILDAGLEPEDPSIISTHTPPRRLLAILSKLRAVKTLFGDRAGDIPISATKSLIGHSIGASAALMSSIATIMALHTGTVHPTINLGEADPECDLDCTPSRAQQRNPRVGLVQRFRIRGK